MRGFISITTMMVLGVALLGLAAAGPAPSNFKVHERMTVEEIRLVFQTEPDAVPEYQVTQIQLPKLHKRAAKIGTARQTTTHMRLNAFGRSVPLRLQSINSALVGDDTPVYHARADEKGIDGVRFDKLSNPMFVVRSALEDNDMKATLIVKRAANGKQLVFGYIGSEKWTIRPLPVRFNYRNLGRQQRSVDDYDKVENSTIAEDDEHHYHVIYKIPAVPEGTKYASLPIGADVLDKESSRLKRAVNPPSTIYPQLLVVADYATFLRHNKSTYGLLEYLITFWNGVDLRYRGLENPKIRFSIAGIIIETDPNALYYIWQSRVTTEKLNIYAALESSGIFRRKIEYVFPAHSSDIMVTMSPYDMCDPTKADCPVGIIGLSFMGGACKHCDYPHCPVSKTTSVAVIRDKGGFDGVETAVHEFGHLFGANHDGAEGVDCPPEVGHVMAPSPQQTENHSLFSQCSLNAMDTFFREQMPVCLFDWPRTTYDMPRVFPGRLQTMDKQCLMITGTKTCFRNPAFPPKNITKYKAESCLKLRCLDSTGKKCESLFNGPADGTICDEGMSGNIGLETLVHSQVIQLIQQSKLEQNSKSLFRCDMCSLPYTQCQILGKAYIGGACKNLDNSNPRSTSSVAIIQDKGGFDGVQTAAHELGHLFGANHDGDAGVGCSKATGHIMGPHPELSQNVGNWSSCSLQAFDNFFKNASMGYANV